MTEEEQLGIFDAVEAHPAVLTPDQIFAALDQRIIVEAREDDRIERKPAQFAGAEIGKYVSMWANTEPDGGIIVLGVLDDGRIEGVERLGPDRMNKILKAPKVFAPDARCQSKRIPITNHRGERDFVIAIRVSYHKSRVVRDSKGDAYWRFGDEKRKLRLEEVAEIAAEKGERSFEKEPCGLDLGEDFDTVRMSEFVRHVRRVRKWSHDLDEIEVLELMHLGERDRLGKFVPNVACALLFALDPRATLPGCRVRFLRFDGEHEGAGDKWNAIKDEVIDGSLPDIIEETNKLIEDQIRTFSRLGPDGKFYTQREYPQPAWYEAVVNACVHRSYGDGLRNISIFVKVFDDRLVVESPGPLPPFVTPDNIYHVSQPRNPDLMEALRHMEFVKCAHEGTRRMRDTMTEMSLPSPEFEEREVGHPIFRVTLRNNVHQRKAWVDKDVTELVGTVLAASLGDRDKRILNFVAEHEEISVSEAARLANCTWHTAKRALVRLMNMGVLRSTRRPGKKHDTMARYRLHRPSS